MRLTVSVLVGLAGLAFTGCTTVSEMRTGAPTGGCQIGEPMVETRLFMGLTKPGGTVSRFEFNQFVETEVVPRWKEGFTVVDADGFWLSSERNVTIQEDSRILIRVHGGSAAESADIEAIRAAYRKAFRQDSVLRTDSKSCADF